MRRLLLLLTAAILLAACGSQESVIPYEDIPTEGDPVRGAQLYDLATGTVPSCSSCHLEEGSPGAPSLVGYADVAGERVEGESAHEYTFYAIAEPGRYIVEGYGNAMYNRYDENLSPQDIADLIAYLLEQ